ncbi:flagellar biosynthesis protein FlhB [Mariluticola halotolerans]|uniref:flagellar biosynthesis protein FlhB n=1 Tax=Mariluticola halotolerans TaxID=2909283 RepID=UPI0026E2D876|nr:flagellar biosynthesis protein FlhB [Mariluticola halotolerans]UJQ95404.1 flagellar biosynthesis protein FlhB [Mariluticola halotolerans]
MADEPDKSEKTEDPSQKKLDDAHKRGDVAKSQEVTTWFMIFGSTLVFALLAPRASASLLTTLETVMANADLYDVSGPGFLRFFSGLSYSIMLIAIVPLGFLAIAAVAANLIQHKPVLSVDPIKPKWSKISPAAGFKRLFSAESLVNFLKGLLKLTIVGAVMFFVLWPERDRLDTLMTVEPLIILAEFQELGLKIFAATLIIITIIAAADYMYQRYRWWERQKMTIKEVRDEYKQMEGDPQVKGRIRQIRQQRAQNRMMASVPDATVVVTNPTHYAIALKYDETMNAPVCVAKGADAIALKIRELANENKVPIVENPPLARALYVSVDIEGTIPTEHFKAVAQVIGYVMRLRSRKSWSS